MPAPLSPPSPAVPASFVARSVTLDRAIEQLEAALAGFGGTLLLVSHDRRLLDSVQVNRSLEPI